VLCVKEITLKYWSMGVYAKDNGELCRKVEDIFTAKTLARSVVTNC
jgi:hypothetical protein